MWTKMMSGPRKKAPKTIAVIDPDRCFGAFACSICQAACPVADCIVEEPDRDGRMVCAVRADLCIGCGLCVTLGNPTAPQQREFGCPADYDAINMMPFEEVVKALRATDETTVDKYCPPANTVESSTTSALGGLSQSALQGMTAPPVASTAAVLFGVRLPCSPRAHRFRPGCWAVLRTRPLLRRAAPAALRRLRRSTSPNGATSSSAWNESSWPAGRS